MSQIGFICPDGQSIKFEQCFKTCRMCNRCVSMPTLRALAVQRKWIGLPSTTQLLAGTRHAYLKIVKDYYEDIQKLAWILLGNKTHKQLEDADTDGTSEIVFKSKVQSGILDYYDRPTKTLWDYKASGAYKVHKALGLVNYKIDDPTGARYKKGGSGFKKGDIKQVKVWKQDLKIADKWDWILQTNRYAIWLQDDNMPVEQIKIEIIVRDGGLRIASMYGIDRNIVIIDIPILNRDYVLDYFNRKASMLRTAIAVGWSPRCTNKECWGGRKCEGYCSVSLYCNEMSNEHPMAKKFENMQPEILC